MTENLSNFFSEKLEESFQESLRILFKEGRKQKTKGKYKELEKLFQKKIKTIKNPEVLLKDLIAFVLEKEFGYSIKTKPYYERMVSAILEAFLLNSELKNRLLKMALKYLGRGSSPKNLKN